MNSKNPRVGKGKSIKKLIKEQKNRQKILVPLDGSKNSQRGFKKALSLAKHDDASILAVHVVVFPAVIGIRNMAASVLENDSKNAAKNLLEEAKSKAEKKGVVCQYKIIQGSDPGYDIIKFTEKNPVDMIVVGARGLSKLKQIFLGSVSNYIIQKSKVPVLLVK